MDSRAYKIILNDPKDTIVKEEGSLKTLLSEELCKRFLVLNKTKDDSNSINISINNSDNAIE